MFKSIALVIGAILLGLGLLFGLQMFGFASFSFFAPKMAEVRNEVFHNTQAYTDGMANDLGDLKMQYEMAPDQARKDSIRAIVKQRFAGYDKSKLPADLRDWYFSL